MRPIHATTTASPEPTASTWELSELFSETVSCIKVAIVHSWAHLEARLAGMVAEVVAGPGRRQGPCPSQVCALVIARVAGAAERASTSRQPRSRHQGPGAGSCPGC